MPPQPEWFAGADRVGAFLRSRVLLRAGDFALAAAAANGQPAFVTYLRRPDGRHHAHGVQVLSIDGPRFTGIVSFNDARLVDVFGRPPVLPEAAGGAAR